MKGKAESLFLFDLHFNNGFDRRRDCLLSIRLLRLHIVTGLTRHKIAVGHVKYKITTPRKFRNFGIRFWVVSSGLDDCIQLKVSHVLAAS